jgi:hypothetical protein
LHWQGRERTRRRKRKRSGDITAITTDTVMTQMTNEVVRGGGEKTIITGVADQSDDIGQIHIQDLHRPSGEETALHHPLEGERDHGHRFLEERGHVPHSHDEIDHDHQ